MNFELDEKMNKGVDEAKRNYIDRDARRRKKRKIKKIIALAVLAIIACLIALVVYNYFAGRAFRTEKQFKEFADRVYSRETQQLDNDDAAVSYTFDKDFSVASRMDDNCTEEIKNYRNSRIESVTNYFRNQYLNSDNDMSYALIWDVYQDKTDSGADSIAISYRLYGENSDEVCLITNNIETHLYSSETGRGLQPLQVLNTNYKYKAAEYAENYLKNKYGDEKLKPGWEEFTKPEGSNYNKFYFSGDNIIFLFDEDTVLDKEEGAVSVSIASRFMEQAVRPQILERYINPQAPMVAITYDDGPGGESEERILKCLQDNGSVATFFYLGNRVHTNPDALKKADEIGCQIGSHLWNHDLLTKLKDKEIRKQVKKTGDAIEKACGVRPDVARPPYGAYDTRVIDAIGMPSFLWTIDTLDWKTRNPKAIFKSVKKSKNLDGSVILMHSIYNETADATELIVPWLREHGYQTVTLNELVEYKTGSLPQKGVLYRKIK